MRILRQGDRGASVELLQLALTRAGHNPVRIDGIFGMQTAAALRAFQRNSGLVPDAIAGPKTHQALMPYYVGYVNHRTVQGDSFYRLAVSYKTTLRAIETANPKLDPFNLKIGSTVVIPLGFPLVPTNISWSSTLNSLCVQGLQARYPFISTGAAGISILGKPIHYIKAGSGANRVLYNASHHANEWLTTPVLMHFMEELLFAYSNDEQIFGTPARDILKTTSLWLVPMVNPDGVDLVTGDISSGADYNSARALSAAYPQIPFPSGWKANIRGTDLNLQYPAGWEIAREIKFAQGFDRPGPRDYVGNAPLSASESRAMYQLTRSVNPALTLAYHSQGQVIYWKYLDFEPPLSREIAMKFGAVSGYTVEETPYSSGFAGYKDWFIQDFDRPGYTIEMGLGENPLPVSQFDKIYQDNLGILTLGMQMTSDSP